MKTRDEILTHVWTEERLKWLKAVGELHHIKKAMDEYAKQEAKGFSQWANSTHQYMLGATSETKNMWFPRDRKENWINEIHSDEKMFEKYLQSKNKKQDNI